MSKPIPLGMPDDTPPPRGYFGPPSGLTPLEPPTPPDPPEAPETPDAA